MSLKLVDASSMQTGSSEKLDQSAIAFAHETLEAVQKGGTAALMECALKFGELKEGESIVVGKAELKDAYDSLDAVERGTIERVAARIKTFAEAQRASLREMTVPIPGGEAGHTVAPVDVAGCYAPGGRYPLPSSVLMTAVTARAAGCKSVIVATPKPLKVTLAAAHVAGADAVLAIGGAHAIAALATGAFAESHGLPRADVICGPGNKWVTAAKAACTTAACVGIDMLAGPSEVLVIADESACASTVAADLLAQAEHDVVARPILVAYHSSSGLKADALAIIAAVNVELAAQLATLPTKAVASPAVACGFAVACESVEEAVRVSDAVAPEHLEVITKDAQQVAAKCNHYGGLFVGGAAAEVLGDYGIGPNHTLPTSGTARYTGGLSVMAFLRVRTWMRIDDLKGAEHAVKDAVVLARIEGLEGHARAAEKRLLPADATAQGAPDAKKPKL